MTKIQNDKIQSLITAAVDESRDVMKLVAATMAADIARAGRRMAEAIQASGKILVCGNGGSAADAQHLAAELVGRFLADRDAWAAIALTTDTSVLTAVANDFGFDTIFERQVQALGRPGDVLVGITTSGNSPNVLRAMTTARAQGMFTIGLTGQGGGRLADVSGILLSVPSGLTPRIQEAHGLIVHLLCEIVEKMLIYDS